MLTKTQWSAAVHSHLRTEVQIKDNAEHRLHLVSRLYRDFQWYSSTDILLELSQV